MYLALLQLSSSRSYVGIMVDILSLKIVKMINRVLIYHLPAKMLTLNMAYNIFSLVNEENVIFLP